VLAIDASVDMVRLAQARLGDRADVWCQDVLDPDLDLAEPVDAIISTAAIACGDNWPGPCGQAGHSKSSAEASATSPASAR
jgi:hypothetical protein